MKKLPKAAQKIVSKVNRCKTDAKAVNKLASAADAKSERAAAAVRKRFGVPEPVKPAKAAKANEVTVRVGPYGTEAIAEQEPMQFRQPNVFAYRSALFPLPQNYGVTVTMRDVKVVRETDANPLNPFKVQLTVTVQGPAAKAANWIQSLKNRVRQTP